MAIIFSNNFPANNHQAIAEYLVKIASGKIDSSIKNKVIKGTLTVSEPLRIYDMAFKELVAGTPLDNLNRCFWRHLLLDKHQDMQAIAEIELTEVRNKTQRLVAKVAALHQGARAEGTRKALEAAQKLCHQVTKSEYEIALVQCDDVYFMALWLKNISGGEDLFLPVEPDQTSLNNTQPYTLAQITEVLQPLSIAAQQALLTAGG